MTAAETQDASAALDVMDEFVTLERAEPDVLLSELATLLLGLQGDSPYRPRVHRMLGVVQRRLKREDEAERELAEAKQLAESQSPPDYRELAKIGRELADVHASRGETAQAAEMLQTALAFAGLENDSPEMARIIAALGALERDASRFDAVVKLYGGLVSKGAVSTLPPRDALAVRIDLCQALNQLARHQEALQQVAALREGLLGGVADGAFLAQIEEARALSGLGRHEDAERALAEAEKLLPEGEAAPEQSAFIQAATELQEAKGGTPAVQSLLQLVANESHAAQEVVFRRALANVLMRRGEAARASEALALALRSAVRSGLSEAAAEIRMGILKCGAAQVEDFAASIDLIGGREDVRRLMLLRRFGAAPREEAWLAADLNDGELVTLRTVDLEGASDAQREATIAAFKTVFVPAVRVQDPRIAGILSLRLAPGRTLFVMQRYIEGQSLREFYALGRPHEPLLEMLAGVADALAVLHAEGLAHRDLTPESVVVARNAQGAQWPVLIGLGVPSPAVAESTFEPAGTTPYMAPEQAEGQPGDARSDLYALGQMIAEIWGGKVPTRQGLGRLWQRGTPDGMPRAIEELVRSLSAQDPVRRKPDLSDVAEALRRQSREGA